MCLVAVYPSNSHDKHLCGDFSYLQNRIPSQNHFVDYGDDSVLSVSSSEAESFCG